MREYKFRAWNDGEMFVGVGLTADSLTPYIIPESEENQESYLYMPEATLMQYTGLKDKNGKECYEDDLIKIDDMIYRVEWNGAPNGAGFFLGMYKGSGMSAQQMYKVQDGEIVGNIYEN